jgi:hypothetical protein
LEVVSWVAPIGEGVCQGIRGIAQLLQLYGREGLQGQDVAEGDEEARGELFDDSL